MGKNLSGRLMRRKADDLGKFNFPMFKMTSMLTTLVGSSLTHLKKLPLETPLSGFR
jgi:hypothetical protein